MIKRIISHPLFSGSTIMIGGSMGVNAFNYIYHLLMGKLLGPEDYGTLASLFSVLYMISIVPSSSSFAVVKFISSANTLEEKREIFTKIYALFRNIALWGAVGIALLSPFINQFLHIDDIFAVLCVSGVFYLSMITLVNQSTLQGLLLFIGVVGPNMVSSVGKLIFGVLFVYIGWSVRGATFAVVVGVALAYLYSRWLIKFHITQAPKSHFNVQKFMKYSFPVLMQALAFTSLFTTDLILVKHYFPPFEAGIYAALSTLGKIIFFAATPVAAVMFPLVSGRSARGEKYKHIFHFSLLLTAGISAVIILFYYLFPRLAIVTLYDERYLAAQTELVWMGIFMLFYSMSHVIVNYILSLGETKIVVIPVLAAMLQIIFITIWHGSLLFVIQISLALMVAQLLGLVGYMGYNQLAKSNETK